MADLEVQYRVLKLLEENPNLSQRDLSAKLGVSLGKTHYVVKALIDVGWVKLGNFKRSNTKLRYTYLLTPKGVVEKAALTSRFLKRKQAEFERLREEIEQLKAEVEGSQDP